MDEGTGNGNGNDTSAGTGDVQEFAWEAQLPTELRGKPEIKGKFKTVGELAKTHLDSQAQVSELQGIKEKFDALPKAPAKPEDYDFKGIEGMDEPLVTSLRPELHKLGLSNDTAKSLVALQVSIDKKRNDAYIAQKETERVAQETALKTEWGANYPVRVEKLTRFWNSFKEVLGADKKNTVDYNSFMLETGLGNNPSFIRLMDALANKFSEDSTPSGGQGGKGERKGLVALFE